MKKFFIFLILIVTYSLKATDSSSTDSTTNSNYCGSCKCNFNYSDKLHKRFYEENGVLYCRNCCVRKIFQTMDLILKISNFFICERCEVPNKEESRFALCNDHLSCEKCLKKYVKKSIRKGRVTILCPYKECHEKIPMRILKKIDPDIKEKIALNKENYTCSICFNLVDTNYEDRYFTCEDHWICKNCLKLYIATNTEQHNFSMLCFAKDCKENLSLDLIRSCPQNTFLGFASNHSA